MTREERQLAQLQAKIDQITQATGGVTAQYREQDNSVQAELRLSAEWRI